MRPSKKAVEIEDFATYLIGMPSLRPPRPDELNALSALCLRSKAVWGYDEDFMAACREELRVTAEDLRDDDMQVAVDDEGVIGLVQVSVDGDVAELEKLFIDPDRMRTGAGRHLFDWAAAAASERGARCLMIDADPDAAPFYRRMGARDVGSAPSMSVPGRFLPRLQLDLTRDRA